MRMRKKPNLIPRMERCSEVLVEEPLTYYGEWLNAFNEFERVSLELGCGKGNFTLEKAKESPDILMIALERVPEAMVVAMERVYTAGLKNVLFMSMDAANIGEVFSEGEVFRIYINFCDPWPSRKHVKRRLTSGEFLSAYKGILQHGGEIHFKTDNTALFDYSLVQFEDNGFVLSEVTRNLHGDGIRDHLTDYEKKFHSRGIPICRCVAKLLKV